MGHYISDRETPGDRPGIRDGHDQEALPTKPDHVPALPGGTLHRRRGKAALEIVRHHRLLELYLSETLGVPWERVHEEAEKLEHVISEDLEDRMARVRHDPSVEPHGAPIPARDGTIRRGRARPLSAVDPGETVTVLEVDDRDPELLKYLGRLELYPGTVVRVTAVEPFEGPLVLHVNHREITLGRRAADGIRVTMAA